MRMREISLHTDVIHTSIAIRFQFSTHFKFDELSQQQQHMNESEWKMKLDGMAVIFDLNLVKEDQKQSHRVLGSIEPQFETIFIAILVKIVQFHYPSCSSSDDHCVALYITVNIHSSLLNAQ